MFGLYGDLPPAAKAENDVKTTGWGSSLKPPRKITTNLAPPPAVIRRQGQPQAVTIRPAVTGDSGAPSQSSGASDITASVVSASGSLSAAVQEEYDPARPNNYEDVRAAAHFAAACADKVVCPAFSDVRNLGWRRGGLVLKKINAPRQVRRQRELRRKAAELEEKRKQLEERRKVKSAPFSHSSLPDYTPPSASCGNMPLFLNVYTVHVTCAGGRGEAAGERGCLVQCNARHQRRGGIPSPRRHERCRTRGRRPGRLCGGAEPAGRRHVACGAHDEEYGLERGRCRISRSPKNTPCRTASLPLLRSCATSCSTCTRHHQPAIAYRRKRNWFCPALCED